MKTIQGLKKNSDEYKRKFKRYWRTWETPETIVIWSEECNFHFIEWVERGAEYGYRYENDAINYGSANEREQLKRIIKLYETQNPVKVNDANKKR